VQYSFFDAAVNAILIEAGLLDLASSEIIGLVVENSCVFFASLAFPEAIEVGVAVERLGRTSVRYLVSAFKAGAPLAAAQGRYTHVYVERATQRPTPHTGRPSAAAGKPAGRRIGMKRSPRAPGRRCASELPKPALW
jgi:acyl-CoA thioester hydrolase